MTQVKFFEADNYRSDGSEAIEQLVNQFLKENANSIKVIDIKYTTKIPELKLYGTKCAWTVMIIYETL